MDLNLNFHKFNLLSNSYFYTALKCHILQSDFSFPTEYIAEFAPYTLSWPVLQLTKDLGTCLGITCIPGLTNGAALYFDLHRWSNLNSATPETGAANCNFWLGQSGSFQAYVKWNLKISITGPNINRKRGNRLCIFCLMGFEVLGKYSNIWLPTRVAVPIFNIFQIF